MALLLFLNELSYSEISEYIDIDNVFNKLVLLLREVRRVRSDMALITVPGFDAASIGTSSVRQWSTGGRNRDAARFIRALRNRAPMSTIHGLNDQNLAEYDFNGTTVAMLAGAHLHEGLGVGLQILSEWNVDEVILRRNSLTEQEETGDLELAVDYVKVRYAAGPQHVERHKGWIVERGLRDINTGSELWDCREEMFPQLRFLPRVANDLASLQPVWLRPVKEVLRKLTLAVLDCSSGSVPQWRSKVTPEAEQRKRLCWFDDPVAGSTWLFDLHARMTPGAGRLHFRWDGEHHQVVVAYIGHKL